MGGFLSLLASWFLGAFTRLFGVMAANVLATKIILTALFVVVLPIVLNNVLYGLMDVVFSAAQGFASTHDPDLPTVVSLTGLAGYMADVLGLIDAFSVVLSAMALRFMFTWIPFIGPK